MSRVEDQRCSWANSVNALILGPCIYNPHACCWSSAKRVDLSLFPRLPIGSLLRARENSGSFATVQRVLLIPLVSIGHTVAVWAVSPSIYGQGPPRRRPLRPAL
ncbi:hypothetical protein DL93DRAFT_2071869 [Clavulina sp. PMI_390]|nr:hypothetical protein DL93DRAFT_2071869 [Clavulina sp. PMI_390]